MNYDYILAEQMLDHLREAWPECPDILGPELAQIADDYYSISGEAA